MDFQPALKKFRVMNPKMNNNQKNRFLDVRFQTQNKILEYIGVHCLLVKHEKQIAGIADCGNHFAFD